MKDSNGPLPDTERGLYAKYEVHRIDDPEGKHDDCQYFVLDVKHDEAARFALREYAAYVRHKYPSLADDLERMVRDADG